MNTPNPATSPQPNQFKALIAKNQDMVLVFLSTQMNELFNHTDQAFMDFAERTQNHTMQSRFFEAMTTVRKSRADIEQRFRVAIIESFANFTAKATVAAKKVDDDELSLLDQDEMEESVIGENLITRSRNNYFTQLYALTRRLSALNPERNLTEERVPAGPTHLVLAFRQSISALSIHMKAKIVMYALYDKFVLRQLQSVYDEFNDSLKNAGILPNLKPMASRSKNPPDQKSAAKSTAPDTTKGTSKDKASGSETPPQKLGEELFDSIRGLLSNQRGDSTRPPSEPTVPREDLVSAIDKVRPAKVGSGTGVLADIESLPRIAVDPEFLDRVKQVLSQEREQVLSQVDRNGIQAIDGDTIDLIGMLFEYMLKDPLLPNVAKALLSHLHTPYLKLALTDQKILIDNEHPARLLLDLLVEAGGKWVSELDIKRGIFPQIQVVVDRVLQEVCDNQDLFAELLEYFRAAMEQQRRKSDGIERRSQDTLKGKEKLLAAKRQAAQEIEAHIKQIRLPDPVEQFLLQAWTDRLAFILLRHADGEKSQEWQQAMQMTDNLVWLFDPGRTNTPQQELEGVRVSILGEIKTTLETMGGYHQQHLEALFQFLSDPKAILEWRNPSSDNQSAESLFDPDELMIRSASSMAKVPITATLTPTTPKTPTYKVASEQAPAATTSKTTTLTRPAIDVNLTDQEQAMVEKLRHVKFGTWFELKDSNNNPRRLKLSWLSPATLTCMFVDQAGVQAEVKTLAEIARMLTSGKARVLPQPRQQFVQRTLVAIKGALQRAMEATD